MSYIITAIVFVLIFSVLVLIHELGHFVVAKRAGIKIEEFGFGLPPRLWGKKKGETIYSINWIPFGGFVRMLGEDSSDKKALDNNRSFAAQSPWVRIKVVCAGVVMNFLLAWLLLAIAFSAGTQPFMSPSPSGDSNFILGPDKISGAIDDGLIDLELGVAVAAVEEGSTAQTLGFQVGDQILAVNGDYFNGATSSGTYTVSRGDELVEIVVGEGIDETFGLSFVQFGSFPWVQILNIDDVSPLYSKGVRSGDVIVSLNGKELHSIEDLEAASKSASYNFRIFNAKEYKDVALENDGFALLVSAAFEGMPAFDAGIRPGDKLLSIDGNKFSTIEDAVKFIAKNPDKSMKYTVNREGEMMDFQIKSNENNIIGIGLSLQMSYDFLKGSEISATELVTSSELGEIKYPVHIAVYESFKETLRMTKFTAYMFVDFLGGLVSRGDIPDTVAGPVGIAQLTHGFVQEGFIPVLVFMAILSLSLAAINILPIPALDGGRLLFILLEILFVKKLSQRNEAYVHMIGYVLILLLILVVTYGDILRLFK